MKKFTHDDHEHFRDILETCIYSVIFISCTIYTVFVFITTHHIEDILNKLAEGLGF